MYNSGVWLYFDISVFRVHMCTKAGCGCILLFQCFVYTCVQLRVCGLFCYFCVSCTHVYNGGVWFILIFKCFVSFPLFTTDEIQKKTNKLLY